MEHQLLGSIFNLPNNTSRLVLSKYELSFKMTPPHHSYIVPATAAARELQFGDVWNDGVEELPMNDKEFYNHLSSKSFPHC